MQQTSVNPSVTTRSITRSITGRVAQVTQKPHSSCNHLTIYAIFVKPFGSRYSTEFTLITHRKDGASTLDGQIIKFSQANKVIVNKSLAIQKYN